MSSYTTNTSDKSRKQAMKLLLSGGLGFHLFYVGRIKAGIVRFVFCFFFWLEALVGIFAGKRFVAEGTPPAVVIIGSLALIVIFNLPDLVKLQLGAFKDNVGNPLRE